MTAAPAANPVVKAAAAAPDPALMAEVGVDDGYMVQLRRQEEERRRLKAEMIHYPHRQAVTHVNCFQRRLS